MWCVWRLEGWEVLAELCQCRSVRTLSSLLELHDHVPLSACTCQIEKYLNGPCPSFILTYSILLLHLFNRWHIIRFKFQAIQTISYRTKIPARSSSPYLLFSQDLHRRGSFLILILHSPLPQLRRSVCTFGRLWSLYERILGVSGPIRGRKWLMLAYLSIAILSPMFSSSLLFSWVLVLYSICSLRFCDIGSLSRPRPCQSRNTL